MVGGEGYLGVVRQVPDPGVGDGELLIGEVDGPALAALTDHARPAAPAAVPFARQGDHLVLQGLCHRF